MYNKLLYLFNLFLVSVLFACQSKAPEKKELVGTWQNTLLKVEIKSQQGEEGKDSAFVVTQQNWEEKLKIKPIQTNYAKDGTWKSKYFDLSGGLASVTSGKWWLNGDTLWVHTLIPKNEVNFYLCAINNDKATFKTTIDWDSDGIADDLYYGEQERVK